MKLFASISSFFSGFFSPRKPVGLGPVSSAHHYDESKWQSDVDDEWFLRDPHDDLAPPPSRPSRTVAGPLKVAMSLLSSAPWIVGVVFCLLLILCKLWWFFIALAVGTMLLEVFWEDLLEWFGF